MNIDDATDPHPSVVRAASELDAAIFEPKALPHALQAAGQTLGFDHFCLVHSKLNELSVVAAEHSQAAFQAYEAGGWLATDYRAATVNSSGLGELYLDHIAVPEEQRLNSAIYHDLYVPERMAHFAGWRAGVGEETWIYSLARSEEKGQVTAEEASALRQFIPHANRALVLAMRTRHLRVQGMADFATATGAALIILDSLGRAAAVNRHAELIFGADFGVQEGKLWSGRPDSHAKLEALTQTARSKHAIGALKTFVVQRRDGRTPVLVRSTPVRGLGLDALPGARILVTLVEAVPRHGL